MDLLGVSSERDSAQDVKVRPQLSLKLLRGCWVDVCRHGSVAARTGEKGSLASAEYKTCSCQYAEADRSKRLSAG